MAKKSVVNRNLKRAKMADSARNKRAKLKARVYDKEATLNERFTAAVALAALPRNAARTRIRNRCALTGRPRGYYRKFALARGVLRDLAGFGEIPGLVKSSW